MTIIEILNLNKELLRTFQRVGIRLEDVEYIDLFNEYRAMVANGERCRILWLLLPPSTE